MEKFMRFFLPFIMLVCVITTALEGNIPGITGWIAALAWYLSATYGSNK